jgi:hypothetical protein
MQRVVSVEGVRDSTGHHRIIPVLITRTDRKHTVGNGSKHLVRTSIHQLDASRIVGFGVVVHICEPRCTAIEHASELRIERTGTWRASAYLWKPRPSTRMTMYAAGSSFGSSSKSLTYSKRDLAIGTVMK